MRVNSKKKDRKNRKMRKKLVAPSQALKIVQEELADLEDIFE